MPAYAASAMCVVTAGPRIVPDMPTWFLWLIGPMAVQIVSDVLEWRYIRRAAARYQATLRRTR